MGVNELALKVQETIFDWPKARKIIWPNLLRDAGGGVHGSRGGGGWHRGATMGQVCFTAISSNRTCPTVFIALSSVYQIIVLCAWCLHRGGGG